MISGREDALPNASHLALVADLSDEIERHLDRLGRMRGLVTVRVGATGAYRISVTPASVLRLGDLAELGMSLRDAMGVLDDVLSYDTSEEAAVLVMETNPIDGESLTFLIQSLALAR